MSLSSALLNQILAGAADIEDGETGADRCIEIYCEQHGFSKETAEKAQQEAFKIGALEAGIPLSVIEGKTKLSDHFSQDYINAKARGEL